VSASYTFTAELWLWSAQDSWHFVTVPAAISDEIADATSGLKRGFGSVPVEAHVGATRWRTSIFPSKTESAYVLPVKQQVRSAEGLTLDQHFEVTLVLRQASS